MPASDGLAARFQASFDGLAAIGRRADGWHRLAWTAEDRQARAWFVAEAEARGLAVTEDRNANLWAWWGPLGDDAVVTGSHLDTVPAGGAFDGALGVVSGLVAVDLLRERGAEPRRPLAVAALTDEEGGRFGTPCLGSGLMTGHYDPAEVLERPDGDGVALGEAARAVGADPDAFAADPDALARIGAFVELHVEQGRGLVDLDSPIAVGSEVWPHGRWRLDIVGEANHAGTTRLVDRRDPMQVLAVAVSAARQRAQAAGDAVATIGRVAAWPNAGNAVAARASAWLDARAAAGERLAALIADWEEDVRAAAAGEGCETAVEQESSAEAVRFDDALTERLDGVLGGVPRLPTAAGHDAATLASAIPTAMLYVRNPTGDSHTPAEHASLDDCVAGVQALAAVLEDLACR